MSTTTMSNKTKVTVEPGRQDLTAVREFDAPRELVFKAFTDPKIIVKWLSPKRLKMKILKFEPKAGGSYRYAHADENGNEFVFRGVTHELKAPELIIQTFEFEGMPGHVALETTRFESLPNNRTRLVNLTVFQTVQDRDGMVQSGMEGGMTEAYEKLDEWLVDNKE
ncbi:MAG TPA: SRPBCC family protein [Cyclobacteriaceae bacterium]|nr:SRPBCC family protein [Cyclobacteriaceae bacterium]